jgi:hypothetical protein
MNLSSSLYNHPRYYHLPMPYHMEHGALPRKVTVNGFIESQSVCIGSVSQPFPARLGCSYLIHWFLFACGINKQLSDLATGRYINRVGHRTASIFLRLKPGTGRKYVWFFGN